MNEENLRNDSIWSLIARFSIPAIVGMIVNAVYNIVDRMFIGKYVGEEALASLIVVFPIMMFTFALCILLGQGGANLISINIGKGRRDEANKFFTNTVFLGVVGSTALSIVMFIFAEDILIALGSKGAVLEYATDYLKIILIFLPIQTLSFILSSIVRAEGFPKLSMNALIVSALTNIVLDYVFIGLLDLGVAGGAWATGIGQFVGMVVLTAHFVRKKSTLHFRFNEIIPTFDTISNIVVVGFPSFLSTLGLSISMTILNKSLLTYGGVAAVTSMAAINSIFTLVIMPINGIQGGIQPIVGFSHGAKLHKRAKETVVKAMILACSCATLLFLVMEGAPELLLSMFIDSSSETMEGAVIGLRIFMLSLPVIAINILSVGYFQATQKPKVAIFLGLLKQFILFIPLLFILPNFFGLMGVWFAVPLGDFIAVVVSLVMLLVDFRKAKIKEKLKEISNQNSTGELLNPEF